MWFFFWVCVHDIDEKNCTNQHNHITFPIEIIVYKLILRKKKVYEFSNRFLNNFKKLTRSYKHTIKSTVHIFGTLVVDK